MKMTKDLGRASTGAAAVPPQRHRQTRAHGRLEGITVGLGTFLLLFQTTEYGLAISLVGLAVFAVAAARAAVQQTVRAHGVTYFEMVMAATVVASGLAFYYVGYITSAQYTVLFAITTMAASFIVRGYSPKALFKWAALSHLMMIFVVTLVHFPEMAAGLDSGAANRWALRFKPFGLHPNLTGFIFAGAVVFLVYGAMTSRGWMRWIFGSGALLSILAVLSASARGGLLALFLSSILMCGLYWRRIFAPRPRLTILVLALILILLALTWTQILDYFVTILELDSKRRGLDSGGTGRIDRWLTSLDIVHDGRLRLFIGTGLRTIGVDNFGFTSTENSYLNIAIESGLFVFTVTVILFFGGVVRLYRRSLIDPDPVWMFLTWLLIYSCLQSMVNRYLLAIGNSLSFYVLLTAAIAWLPISQKVAAAKLKQVMPWNVSRSFPSSRF